VLFARRPHNAIISDFTQLSYCALRGARFDTNRALLFYLLLMFDLNVEIGDKIDVYNISAMEWSFCYTRCMRKRGLCRRAVSVWLASCPSRHFHVVNVETNKNIWSTHHSSISVPNVMAIFPLTGASNTGGV